MYIKLLLLIDKKSRLNESLKRSEISLEEPKPLPFVTSHNPEIFRRSNFHFKAKQEHIHMNQFYQVDLEKIIKNVDIEQLLGLLPEIINNKLEKSDLPRYIFFNILLKIECLMKAI